MLFADLPEARVRDVLAANLHIIEQGMVALETEFYVPPIFGCTKAYIDILATDSTAAVTIIEVKRADATARQALHEVEKYRFAVANHFGRTQGEVRCIVASTQWRELGRPFSERARDSSYELEGYLLSGTLQNPSASRFEPLPAVESQRLCPIGLLYLCAGSSDLPVHERQIEAALLLAGIDDFMLLRARYVGQNERVTYPFGLAVIRRSLPEMERARRLVALGNSDGLEESAEYLTENPWYAEECEMAAALSDLDHSAYQSMEIIGPEELAQTLGDWTYSKGVMRGACDRSFQSLGIEESLREYLYESDRPNAASVSCAVRARNLHQRQRTERQLDYALVSIPQWSAAAVSFLRDAGDLDGNVLVDCFSPPDIAMILLHEARDLRPDWPSMALIRPSSNGVEALFGFLEFSPAPTMAFASIMDEAIGPPETVMFAMGLRSIWEHGMDILTRLGLQYRLMTLRGEQVDGSAIPHQRQAAQDLFQARPSLRTEVIEYFSFVGPF